MSEQKILDAVNRQGRVLTRKLADIDTSVGTILGDLSAIRRDLAALKVSPPTVPQSPPPAPGPTPPTPPTATPAPFVWEHPGLFHRQTAEGGRLVDIPTKSLPGGRFDLVTLSARLVTAPWNPKMPDGMHGVAWLCWQGMSGSVFIANARGPGRNIFRLATRFPTSDGARDGKGKSSAATSAWKREGGTFETSISMSWDRGRLSVAVGERDRIVAFADEKFDAETIDTSTRSGSQGKAWKLGFGNIEQGKEIPWPGAELHDVRIEMFPAS